MRLKEKISKNEAVFIALDGSAASQTLLMLLPEILSPKNEIKAFFLNKAKGVGENRKLAKKQGIEVLAGKFSEKDFKKLGKKGRIALPFSLEDEAVEKLQSFLKKSKKKSFLIKPLNSTPEKEIEFYCKLKKIPFEKQLKKERLRQWLNDFEKEFPGTGFSLMKSLKQLENLK